MLCYVFSFLIGDGVSPDNSIKIKDKANAF